MTVKAERIVKSAKARPSTEVLRYHPNPISRATVRRHYAKWRQEQGLAVRCDNPTCSFHAQPLVWGGKPLPLILDHVNGNSRDNRPANLRFLCPNCESQLPTRGGANRGRVVEAVEGKYTLLSRDGRLDYHLFPEAGPLNITGHAPSISVRTRGDAR